jgi:hypothetical protein
MATSNHERVGRVLKVLNAGLMSLFERELRAAFGDRWHEEARQVRSWRDAHGAAIRFVILRSAKPLTR